MKCSEINAEIRRIEDIAMEVMEDCIKNEKNGISHTNLSFLAELIPFLNAVKSKYIG